MKPYKHSSRELCLSWNGRTKTPGEIRGFRSGLREFRKLNLHLKFVCFTKPFVRNAVFLSLKFLKLSRYLMILFDT